jgi:hypothetical protein
MSDSDLVKFLKSAYPNGSWPRPFHILEGLQKIAAGLSVQEAAKAVGTGTHHLRKAQQSTNPEFDILGFGPSDVTDDDRKKAATILGGLLLGQVAERAFEDIYRSEMGQDAEFKLVDLRESRTDTDYRVLNGRERPIYRLNIKFFGSTFRRGLELVGLDPEDCFPLATYKIIGALEKQNQEHLPYVFTIVGVPNLTAISIRDYFNPSDIQIMALITKSERISGKRNLEELIVNKIVAEQSTAYTEAYNRIRSAEWYVLSARKAFNLLHSLLIERVYALRVRNFAQQFRGAELDMHFSLKKDLVTLKDFLHTLREEGQTKMASLLERGTF